MKFIFFRLIILTVASLLFVACVRQSKLPKEIPTNFEDYPLDFIGGLRTVAVNGDPDAQTGMAAHLYLVNQSMARRAFVNADGELLIVPQQGALHITTELGRLHIAPGQIALIPRGMAFKVAVDGPSRGFVCENYGAALRLPELGPIGSNGLANARDFQAPVAWHEVTEGGYEIVKKYGGQLWTAQQDHTPFDVVAWHGNLCPYQYDTAHFMTRATAVLQPGRACFLHVRLLAVVVAASPGRRADHSTGPGGIHWG